MAPGLCVRGCRYSLGYSQVQFIAQSKTGNASQTEETAPGDGEEDAHRETFHHHGQKSIYITFSFSIAPIAKHDVPEHPCTVDIRWAEWNLPNMLFTATLLQT